MPRGDKSAYTDKQKRMAEPIEGSYEQRGVKEEEAERRAWATVNRETGGGRLSGSGRGHATSHEPWRGGTDGHSRSGSERSVAAKKAGRQDVATPLDRVVDIDSYRNSGGRAFAFRGGLWYNHKRCRREQGVESRASRIGRQTNQVRARQQQP